MTFSWLKTFLPRGLYGRAALILILPIVTIQLVVSIGFIQRHFEDVTRQMTQNIVRELDLMRDMAASVTLREAKIETSRLATPLGFDVSFPATPQEAADTRRFYDFSGRVVIATLRDAFPDIPSIRLANLRRVQIVFPSRFGPMLVEFDRRRVSASNPHQLLVIMALTSLLMTAIAYLFLRNQLRPIRRLARAADAFGKGRIVDYRPTGSVEVRLAGNAFLDMRARIERQIEQRTLLLSGVSHDLRTPITRLRLALSLLPEGEDTEAMARDIDEMSRLLDAFLTYIRDDTLEENPEPTDPAALVRAIVEDAVRAGQDVTLTATEGSGTAPLRPGAIRRALDNLIGNAVRYGKRAEVSVAVLDRSVRISVEDDGPGIPRERRDEALRPFTRLDGARNQDRGTGVGLGLAITADIARSHGGVLRLGESERMGGLKAELVFAR